MELTTAQRIRAVQNQLRIAIQNHQLLFMRRKSCPGDPDIQNHMNVIQGLIISMGRTQAELMAQFREEIAEQYDTKSSDVCISNIISKHLSWPDAPKNIPIYNKSNGTKKSSEKKVSSWGHKGSKKEVPLLRKSNKMQSLLKINNEKEKNGLTTPTKNETEKDLFFDHSKVKIVYKSSGEDKSLLKKKMQSVLKPKNEETKNDLTKKEDSFNNKLDSANSCSEEKLLSIDISSEPNSPCSSQSDVKFKESPSQSECQSDEAEFVEAVPPPAKIIKEQKFQRKMETRLARKRERYNIEKREKGFYDKHNGYMYRTNGFIDPRFMKPETETPESLDDLSQDSYLRFFGLINRSQCDMLKRKRCERKRRSVAGQSSMYSDYFQPTTPRRSYGPRKAVSVPTSPNNQVIVETVQEIDLEDEKPNNNQFCCIVCNDNSDPVETCPSCSEVYHTHCVASGCPNCSADVSNLRSIVGAATFTSSSSCASSTEVIKRYLDKDEN